MTNNKIGTAPIKFTGNALYLTIGGGEFTHGDTKGSFASTTSGTAMIVYIRDGGSYQVDIEDVIKAAVVHHKKKRTKSR